jgi:hypothetical protein
MAKIIAATILLMFIAISLIGYALYGEIWRLSIALILMVILGFTWSSQWARGKIIFTGMILFGSVMIYVGVSEHKIIQDLGKSGITVQAESTGKVAYIEPETTRLGWTPPHYYADFRFSTPSGQTVDTTLEISKDMYEQIKAGKHHQMSIQYLESNPEKTVRAAGTEEYHTYINLFNALFGTVLTGMGVYGLLRKRTFGILAGRNS